MLRHNIMSVSLAMTACAILIPTKAKAFSLTFTPYGTIPKNPGDLITFNVFVNPAGFYSPTPKFKGLQVIGAKKGFDWDGDELAFVSQNVIPSQEISNTTEIANITFRVLPGIKEGGSDFFNVIAVFDTDYSKGLTISSKDGNNLDGNEQIADIVPVPEPLTIFGTVTALGCGTLFKRKSSKKKS